MAGWSGITPSASALGSRLAVRELRLNVELLRVQVVPDQARDERALLVATLNAIALETFQLFVVEQHADLRFSWFPQLAFRRE